MRWGSECARNVGVATTPQFILTVLYVVFSVLLQANWVDSVILTPPYFNLAEGRQITASATCGVDTEGPELYCKLVGANAENDENVNVIQGQVCDYCDPSRPDKMHPPDYAVDGMETWWQSPPLSRGMKYNEVNLTIDLGQEFHVAYVYVRMGNSPRPGLWVLEKSSDNGKSYTPWQYFSDSIADCETYFGRDSLQPITRDDSVICSTDYSKIVPLEGGEIPISLLNNRPSANMYFNSSVLQEWTRATNVRLRFLRTKNLLGHLMSVARQDPTVTRRYFYSIKDISIGGRCMCNGHADTCGIKDSEDPKKLFCVCQHHTCGPQCAQCCPGFEQKAWRISKSYKKFECEPCNCFNHTTECMYDAEVDDNHQSLDIHGKYDGGGVCQNCQHNTEGINCNHCKPTYYRPFNKKWDDIDVCQPCQCDYFYSTGNCAEGTGRCECRVEFTPPNCDACSFGYFGYPNCRPCECNLNGTKDDHCEATDGKCPCKPNYDGAYCNQCADTFYDFPKCLQCDCNEIGSLTDNCNQATGNCTCKSNYRGRTCDICEHGYYNYPNCTYCNCDVTGTQPGICDKSNGQCLCKEGYGGDRCDQCIPGYYGYPDCRPCSCSEVGSASQLCDTTGKCPCLMNFAGRTCDQCSPGYYKYPECLACNCDSKGAIGISCDSEGICQCLHNFDTNRCDQCKEGFYNFPNCEDCNCNPAGVVAAFAGCGSVPAGELCQCKERVQGRICDQCRPLYWNLHLSNPEGCDHCDCHLPGVVGGIGVCDATNGQCVCKPGVISRGCSQCADGTYDLQESDVFGCKDCDCDIGGAINNICDKSSGQCQCQARINGRTCREPLQTHFFPTLYQFQYEVEDGRTPLNTHVRYGFDDHLFPDYSWKGYAIFSPLLQTEVIQDVQINKPSVYRVVLAYVNPNSETVLGRIKISPESPTDTEQNFAVQFKPTDGPTFVTVSGAGNVPQPFVMNPGRWAVHITAPKTLFLDYFVLLPAAFYEAGILSQDVQTACKVGQKGLCRHYSYPSISHFDSVHGTGGFNNDGQGFSEYFSNTKQLSELGETQLPLLNAQQREINLNLTITKPGRHVVLITYATPEEDDPRTHHVTVHSSSSHDHHDGLVTMPSCPYTSLCRQAVTDRHHRIYNFHFDTNFITLTLKGPEDANIGIKSAVAIPYNQWSLDYIRPKSVCVRKDGKCVPAQFAVVPDSKKVKFEVGNEEQVSVIRPPNIHDNTSSLIYLDHNDAMVDIRSKVPYPGNYVFVVHYYQPDFPEFDMNVLIQNGQFYEAELPVEHCPSNSGCRAIISQDDGNTRFSLTENFMITLKEPNHKSVWLEYLMVIPAELYTDHILSEQNFDQTREFISTCGGNHFHINATAEGFCRDSVFSLTADYNNGALLCGCDYEGAYSFECAKFGGQCECKPNIIGRKCEACQTGYYGFPECKPCNCPSTAICEPTTGECICPPRVTGKNCDQCVKYSFGFDPIIGCEQCNCNPLGVLNDLQCDLMNGNCACKPNIVGRMCNDCKAGHYAFPYCDKCRCDLRGTTMDICDQQNAKCHCKQYVQGSECDFCVEGSFNLQTSNEEGCTKCFCFGKTTRCSSSHFFRTEIGGMQNWTLNSIIVGTNMTVTPLSVDIQQLNSSTISADLTDVEFEYQTDYFAAPDIFLGNKLTSYGGFINYSILYTIEDSGSSVSTPDLILYGAEMYLLHSSIELPAHDLNYEAAVELVETNFVFANDMTVSRAQMMTVLENLNAIYIRATYWDTGVYTLLSEVSLDVATPDYIPGTPLAVSVEQCQCPPGYEGLSCEECAAGYYRINTGPHGGHCVACQCNGHTDECDVNTGECIECKHNTQGDHCEMCDVGFHGNALHGTPMDCLICACPLPIPSNNFATGCEVSPSGNEISCDCLPGYYGGRCQSCTAGFYGRPELLGDYCKPCGCSGNINPDETDSCDSVTGECLKCLNNTSGEACALCAPGYYGDAIQLKDCQTCNCDPLGTSRCNSYTGQCECLPNVEGEKCDKCLENHFGFTSGYGCQPCECHNASESSQCDDATGQCRCRSGVTGRTCERCAPGFWNYSPEGCRSCGCNTEYSLGFGCNAETGHCECLPGVIGDKCDHCPYRWVLILNNGCFECDSCIHDLLDTTDELRTLIDPVISEFEAVASGYFTSRRLTYLNNSLQELSPLVDALDINGTDILTPILKDLKLIEQDTKLLHRKANSTATNIVQVTPDADELRKEALKILDAVRAAATKANQTVYEIDNLSFDTAEGPKIDQALLEAEYIVKDIRDMDFSNRDQEAVEQLRKARDLLESLEDYRLPIDRQNGETEKLKEELDDFYKKLNDMANYTSYVNKKVDEADDLNAEPRLKQLNDKVDLIDDESASAESNLLQAHQYLTNASRLLAEGHRTLNKLSSGVDDFSDIMTEFNKSIITPELHDELVELVEESQRKSESLSNQAIYLDHILSDTRNISGLAVDAANAYRNIGNATDTARQAADEAFAAATTASEILDGLEDKSLESAENAEKLLQEAQESLTYAQSDLKPQVELANDELESIGKLSNQSDTEYKKMVDALNRLGDQNFVNTCDDAIEISQTAGDEALEALSSISDITENIKNDLERAKQLQKDSDEATRNIQQTQTQLNSINTILPNITNLIDELGPQQAQIQNSVNEIEDKIKKLNHQITMARELANRVKVGVTFMPNTMLELKTPPEAADQITSNHVSVYFKTDKPNGFMMYLGNEKGTKLRRTKTDDYMTLEIENGYPVLTMDIGNEPERIISHKYVADGNWYQAIVDRTGPNVKLTIREEIEGRQVKDHVQEAVLSGTNTIFNLDKDQSRLFVGGYPSNFDIQETVKFSSFEGKMEDLIIGDQHVGLWNFVDAEGNTVGSRQRDQLINLQSDTGYRFNGNGYAILDATPHPLSHRTEVRLSFKTSAEEGLMFLAGGEYTFMAIELNQGRVLYRYDLGDGVVSLYSEDGRNLADGTWHTVTVTRDGQSSILKVDNENTVNGQSGGPSKQMERPTLMFFGGYPNQHSYDVVTNLDFDGCIDGVQILSTPVDLSGNVKAYGVHPGCPVKFAGLVSFSDKAPGYIQHPNVSSANSFKASLKFKTQAPTGLIFYATDRTQSAGVSLALVDKALVLISQRLELNTSHTNYNDNEWHVVTISHNDEELRMDVDDWEYVTIDSPPAPLHIMYGDMFMAGLPPGYTTAKGAVRVTQPFIGCLGDATLNGNIINFANATEKAGTILGKCILDKPVDGDYDDLHKIPTIHKTPDRTYDEPQTTTEEPFDDDKPKRGDGGVDDDTVFVTEPPTSAPHTTTQIPESHEESTEITEQPEPDEVVTEHVIKTDELSPHHTTTQATLRDCALPMDPEVDYTFKEGYRFGTAQDSRLEYDQSRGRYKNQYDFSIEFKTKQPNGLIFYVADVKHTHFVALFMKDGKLNYKFSCGMGVVPLNTDNRYDDDAWHTVVFSRNQTDGKLVVDDILGASGHSENNNKNLNITPPYFLGAVPDAIQLDVQVALNSYSPFVGCLRNFQMNGKPMMHPRNEGVLPCWDNVEPGIFFGPKGGHMRLKDKFTVGIDIDIEMSIKPRNTTGLLMSVHGKRDFLVLQIIDGVIKFTVDNGKGPIEASFIPPSPNYFCDGKWHKIQAIKSKNVVSLSVDTTFANASIGKSHSTDTRFALFLGGHQHQNKRIRGILTKSSFIGCIKDVVINNDTVAINPTMAKGDVMFGICPAT